MTTLSLMNLKKAQIKKHHIKLKQAIRMYRLKVEIDGFVE